MRARPRVVARHFVWRLVRLAPGCFWVEQRELDLLGAERWEKLYRVNPPRTAAGEPAQATIPQWLLGQLLEKLSRCRARRRAR